VAIFNAQFNYDKHALFELPFFMQRIRY